MLRISGTTHAGFAFFHVFFFLFGFDRDEKRMAIKNLKAFHVFPAELRQTPPRICKWYFRVDVKRSHVFQAEPTHRPHAPLPSLHPHLPALKAFPPTTTATPSKHCGRKRPQGKRHWFLFLRSISRFAGQFSSRLRQSGALIRSLLLFFPL